MLLLTANVWFVRSVWQNFFSQQQSLIEPLQVFSTEQKDAALGRVLASMLQAHVAKLNRDMTMIAQKLEASEARSQRAGRVEKSLSPQVTDKPERIGVGKVYEPLNLDVKVGGVELGGFFSWVQRAMIQDRLLTLSAFQDNDSVTISGNVETFGSQPIWYQTKLLDDQAIADVAFLLIQQEYALRRIPQIAPLDLDEFKLMIESLHKVTDLDRRVEMGYTVAKSEYAKLLPAFEALTVKMRKWRALVSMAGAVARNAGEERKSLDFLQKELDLIDPKSTAERQSLQQEIERLTAAIYRTAVQPTPMEGVELVRRLVGVSTLAKMKSPPLIAVVGGVPPDDFLPDQQQTVLSDGGAAEADASMREYIGTVVSAVRLMAPDTRFLFYSTAGGPSFNNSELLKAIDTLVQEKPDILLVTIGPLNGRVFEHVFEKVASSGILIVVAAGNRAGEPVAFEGGSLLDRIMMVAATDLQGQKASFTQEGPKVFWAPGANIPVQVEDRIQPRSGTTYAASIAAGIAARILGDYELELPKLLEILRSAAQPVGNSANPPVVNLDRSISALRGVAEP